MEIVAKRIVLRDFREEDTAAFQEYHGDSRSLEFYGVEEVKRRNYQFAIVQRQGSQLLVGCCGLRTADSEASKAGLGVELALELWGRYGCAIEIVHALLEFAFDNLKLREIYDSPVSANARVARLASAFGAVATTRPTPAWMAARGWSQTEWHVERAMGG